MFSFIPLKVQIYALMFVLLVLALLGLKSAWVKQALSVAEAAATRKRLDQLKIANEVSRETETWDDSHVADVARDKWVRGNGDD